MIRKFTLYWRYGRREVVDGKGILTAVIQAGYFDLKELEFYVAGEDCNYRWNEQTREWVISMPARPLGSATPSLPPHSSASHYS